MNGALALNAIARVENGDTLLDLGEDTLLLRGVTDMNLLENVTDLI